MGVLQQRLFTGLISMVLLLTANTALATEQVIATGTVTNNQGETMEGVEVQCHTANSSFFTTSTTNASGQYSCSGDTSSLVSGTTNINVEVYTPPAGYNAPAAYSFIWTGVAASHDFQLILAAYTVNVTVHDTNGNPIEANVLVQPIHLEPGQNMDQVHGATDAVTGTESLAVSFPDAIVVAGANLSDPDPERYPWISIGGAQEVHFTADNMEQSLDFIVIQSDTKVRVKMVDATGAILTGNDFTGDVYFEGYNETYGAVSTRRKINSLTGVAEVYVLPGVWHVTALHQQLSGQSFDPTETTFVVSDEAGITDLGTIQASINTGVLSGTATIDTGDTVVSADEPNMVTISAVNLDTNDRYFATLQNNGDFIINAVAFGTYAVTVDNNNYIPTQTATVEVTTNQGTIDHIAIAAQLANTTVQGQLVDDDDNNAVENFPGTVVVESANGNNSAPLKPDGSFQINLFNGGIVGDTVSIKLITQPGANGYAQTEAFMIQNGIITVNLTLKTDEATITGSVKNDTNQTVGVSDLGEAAKVTAINTTTGSVERTTVNDDGSFSLAVGPGTWNLVPQIPAIDTNVYASSMSGDKIKVAAGEDKTQNITVLSEDSTISGTIADAHGDPVPEAPVVITNLPALQASGEVDPTEIVSITTTANSQGEVEVTVPNGEYNLVFGTTPDVSNAVAPETITVTAKANKTTTFAAEFQNTHGTNLTGTVAGQFDSATVAAYSPAGGSVTDDVGTNGIYQLTITPGEWDVVVSGVKDGLLYVQQATVTVASGDNDKNFTPTATAITFPSAVSVTDSVDENISLSNTAGAKVDLPAFAAGYSGTITATLTPIVSIVNTGEISQLGLAYEVRVVDDSGIPVTNLNSDATVTLPLDTQLTGGVSDNEITASYYNEALGTNLFDGMAADVKNNTIVIQTKHFSRFSATTTGTVVYAPGQVKQSGLEATHITSHSAKLTWKKPTNSIIAHYKLQLRKKNSTKTKQWSNYSITKLSKIITQLTNKTSYQFHVQACNVAGCSAYTDWKTFKTN